MSELADATLLAQTKVWLCEEAEVGNTIDDKTISGNLNRYKRVVQDKYKRWESQNNTAMAVIYHACSTSIQGAIMNFEFASEQWEYLKDAYTETGTRLVISTMTKIQKITLAGCMSLTQYIGQFQEFRWILSCQENCHMGDGIWIWYIIAGLGPAYDSFVQYVCRKKMVDLTWTEVVSLLRAEEALLP